MVLKRLSIGELIFLLIMFISVLPVADAVFKIGQVPILTFLLVIPYLFFLGLTFIRKRYYFDQGVMPRILLFWIFIMLVRGINFNYEYLRDIFVSGYIFLPFTIPFIVKYFGIYDIKRCINYISLMNIFYLIFIVLNISLLVNKSEGAVAFLENISHYMSFPNFLLLFYLPKITKYQKILSILVYVVGIFFALDFARRSLVWTYAWAGIIAIVFNLINARKSLSRRPIKFFSVIIIFITLFIVFYINSDKALAPLINRLYEDSRGSILHDFFNDMNSFEMLFGKGIGGTYLLKTSSGQYFTNDYRNIIESGVLNIILYGGYVLLFIICIIYIKAIYKGLFKSNNQLARSFAGLILLHALAAYPAGVWFFDTFFLTIWIGIYMCNNKNFIELSDEFIENPRTRILHR